MAAQKLTVSWRGERRELEVCYPASKAAEITGRWPDGVIVIEELFTSACAESSTPARLWLANQALAAAGEAPISTSGVHPSMLRDVVSAAIAQRAAGAPISDAAEARKLQRARA